MYHIGCSDNCYNSDAPDNTAKKKVTLVFHREQLLYDIKNYAYIEGHVWGEDSPEIRHAQHTLVEIGEEGNVDRMTRVLDLTMAKCRETLYPYTKHDIHRPELDDKLKEVPTYGIVLSVPTQFSQTTLNLLGKLIHEYLVCECVADWMSITNPAKQQTWKEKAEDAISEVRSCLLTRMARVRRRSHPF